MARHKCYNAQFQLLFSVMLPDYEKNCLTEFVDGNEGRFVFNSQNDTEITDRLTRVKESSDKESIELFANTVIYQVREVEVSKD